MKSFRKFSQRKENRDYMNQEESVYELNRIQRYIMQMRPLLKKNATFFGWNGRLQTAGGTGCRG